VSDDIWRVFCIGVLRNIVQLSHSALYKVYIISDSLL